MSLKLPQIATTLMLIQNKAPHRVQAYLCACGLALDGQQNKPLVDTLLSIVGPAMMERTRGRLVNIPEGKQPHVAEVHQDNYNDTFWPDRNKGVVSHLQTVPEDKLPEIEARVQSTITTKDVVGCGCTKCLTSGRCQCLNRGQGCHPNTCAKCDCDRKARHNKVMEWFKDALYQLSDGKGKDPTKDDLYCQSPAARRIGFKVRDLKRGAASGHLNYDQLNLQFTMGGWVDVHEDNVEMEVDKKWVGIDTVAPGSVAAEGKRDAEAQTAVLREAPVDFWRNAINLRLELQSSVLRSTESCCATLNVGIRMLITSAQPPKERNKTLSI